MIGAREEELGRTRSQNQEMFSPRDESTERAELTMEEWIQETCLISGVKSGPTEPKTFQEAWHSPIENERENWRSKGMKSVVLSTTEAEYMAQSEVVKLKFRVQLLQTMSIEVELPITVYMDNLGAIWLSNNRTTSNRAK